MSSSALFASSNSRSQSKYLVEFKAGKMNIDADKIVSPDLRKGLIFIHKSDDSLIHFCWKDRQNGVVEDDLIIFPDECEFKRINACTTGRGYVLKFKNSEKRLFFWLQDGKTDKDEQHVTRVNELLNNPPTSSSVRNSSSHEGELQFLLNNLSQQQLTHLFGSNIADSLPSLMGINRSPASNRSTSGSTSSSSSSKTPSASASAGVTTSSKSPAKASTSSTAAEKPAATGATTGGTTTTSTDEVANPISIENLRNLLNRYHFPEEEASVDLSSALTSETLQSILKNPEAVKELQKFLPAEGASGSEEENLKNTISCPQFQQALRTFSTALQSGQLGPVVQQFEVGSAAVNAANQGNMEEFVRALQNARNANSESNNKQAEKRKTTDDDGGEPKKKDSKEE